MKTRNALLMLVCLLCFGGTLSAQSPESKPVEIDPLSGSERVEWILRATAGRPSLVTGVLSSAWSTAHNNPEEYGPQFSGFAKRFGMRLTGVGASNTIEAGLGSFWNEDPRYVPSLEQGVLHRVKHAGRMTFLAQREDGTLTPAYARYIAVPASNFISNSWRVESENSVGQALTRTAMGFAGRFVGNVIRELWASRAR